MNQAKAAVFTAVGQPMSIRSYPVASPVKGAALLGLVASGVCGTDVHILRGKLGVTTPVIVGHEFVGRIEEMSDDDARAVGLKCGDAVIACVACPCGECLLCREHDDANCLNMGVTYVRNPDEAPHLFGGYAEAMYAPVKNLIRVPNSIDPLVAAAFACAGPTAIHAFRLAERAGRPLSGVSLSVVQGLGPVGAFAAMYLKRAGVKRVVAVSARENPARARLMKSLGVEEVYSLDTCDAVAEIRKMSGGVGADLVFEASGNPAAFSEGIDMLRNRGVYLVPGQYSDSGAISLEPQKITFAAITIIGSSQYSLEDIQAYLGFLEAHKELHAPIASLCTRFPVEQANEAIKCAMQGGQVKVLLTKGD